MSVSSNITQKYYLSSSTCIYTPDANIPTARGTFKKCEFGLMYNTKIGLADRVAVTTPLKSDDKSYLTERMILIMIAELFPRHPHLVEFYGFRHSSHVFEKCDGDLSSAIKRGGISNETMCRFSLGLLNAIASFHGVGLVHRDIKPENCMIKNGELKLGDFGTVCHVTDADALVICGTACYLSPETLLRIAQGHRTMPDGYPLVSNDLFQAGQTIRMLLDPSTMDRWLTVFDLTCNLVPNEFTEEVAGILFTRLSDFLLNNNDSWIAKLAGIDYTARTSALKTLEYLVDLWDDQPERLL